MHSYTLEFRPDLCSVRDPTASKNKQHLILEITNNLLTVLLVLLKCSKFFLFSDSTFQLDRFTD